ncbi:hypothetical protein LIER_14415 [Lithospermum erythrorhizon]|uniref:Transposase (putative) gypsy type domain-containing protein n=1 Tax=Lithospermum erythrorhizon TaxID=34254 RepID=A0AAV3PZ28_LITER
MRLPFSMFVNDLLGNVNRALGQIHPIGWLNITIFHVACSIAGVQPIVPLFASLFTSKHRPYDASFASKEGGKLSKNFLAGPCPNKVGFTRFNGLWFFVRGAVRESANSAADHTKVEVAAVKEPFAVVSKKAKIEALATIFAPSSSPNITRPEVIALDDELTTSAHEASGAKKSKEKSKAPTSVRSFKVILPLLAKVGANSKKKGKGKAVASGEESSLNSYTTKYMKASYTLPNGLSIEGSHLWNNRMEAFHAVHPLLSVEKGRKHPSSDPFDAFALSALYMIKALNANYVYTR